MEKKVFLEQQFRQGAPGYVMVYLEADVINHPVSDELTREFDLLIRQIESSTRIPDINRIPPIAATRQAYKRFGKDPNRYRPSQEQMMRRIVKGLGLYHVDSLVDAGNIVSLRSGSSLGVFDRDKIQGDTLTLGIGREGEPYTGIGRGDLNIAGLPVIRDAAGGIGTPTSDHERTKVGPGTTRLSVCMNIYDTSTLSPKDAAALLSDTLSRHCSASNIEVAFINADSADL